MQAYVETPEMAERGLFLRGLRLVVSYVKTHPGPFLIAVGGSMVYALASIGLTVALGRAVDNVLQPAFNGGVASSQIWLAIAAIMAAGTLRAGGIMVRRYYSGVAGARVMATLRTRIADRYRDLSLQFHKETPTGGGCTVGCHRTLRYDREKPVVQ